MLAGHIKVLGGPKVGQTFIMSTSTSEIDSGADAIKKFTPSLEMFIASAPDLRIFDLNYSFP